MQNECSSFIAELLSPLTVKIWEWDSSAIINEIFQLRETNYHLRRVLFIVPPVHTVYNGIESAWYVGSKIWEVISSNSSAGFKQRVKIKD